MKSKFLRFMTLVLVLTTNFAFAQSKEITGTVYDETNMPLPGANVIVQGTTNGTTADFDGNFFINANEGDVLEVSFMGYKVKAVKITGNSNYSVTLEPDAAVLEDVVVVAYGTAKKESFTGSATTVSVENIQKINTDNVTKALEGLSAGVQITSGLGQPGESSTIRIRGIGSVLGSSDPLIVVDGFPYGGNINSIPSDDIESMTVLKDAAAKSLYGSRAANGVIIITTKKGKAGQSNITFKAVTGISSRAIPEYDIMGVDQFYLTAWSKLKNESDAQYATDFLINDLGGYNVFDTPDNMVVDINGNLTTAKKLWNDNWDNELFQNGVRNEYDLGVSGGTEDTQYYISANYLNSQGLVKASNFNRYSARASINTKVNDFVSAKIMLNGSTSDQDYPTSSGSSFVNSFMWTRNIAPIYPVYAYLKDGTPILDANGNKTYDFGNADGRTRNYGLNLNPLGTIALDTRWNKRDIFGGRGSVDFNLADDLKFSTNGSIDYNMVTSMTHQNKNFGDAASFDGRSTRSDSRNFTFTANQILSYTPSFGKHDIGFLAGHETYVYKNSYMSAARTGFAIPNFSELSMATTLESATSYENILKMESYFAQVDYGFANTYFLKASVRTDGSSRFAKENRWGNFWSVSGSWRLDKEAFLENADFIDALKLKASYGTSGNDRIGTYFAYAELWENYANYNMNGLGLSRLATPDLSWEKTGELNIGIEGSIFNKLSFNFEYYNKQTNDLLFERPLAPSTGNTSYDANIGGIKNYGFEFELSYKVINTEELKWTLGVNGAMNRNEFTELPEDGMTVGNKRYEVGRSIYEFYIPEWAGVDPQTGKPTWFMDEVDANGDLTGNKLVTDNYGEATRYFSGTALPTIRGGVSNMFEFMNFDLTVLTSYSFGGKVYDYSYSGLMGMGDLKNNWHQDMGNAWQQPGDVTDVPQLAIANRDFNQLSTRFLRDASYINLTNVTLGYTLPKSNSESIGIKSLRVFVTADNFLTWTNFKGMDPRQSLSGDVSNQYTPIRTISAGINLNL